MKLFLSFTSLLAAIAENKVTEEDLSTGLFYFGCTRDHAYDPSNDGEARDERAWLKEKGAPAYEKLVSALRQAEDTGRCRWYRPELGVFRQPFTLLNELLTANGAQAIEFSADEDNWRDYGYPTVAERISKLPNSQVEALF